jgi:hypothetical protein
MDESTTSVLGDGTSPQDVATEQALAIARSLIDAGVPVFAAPPCPSGPYGSGSCTRPGHGAGGVEYDLPAAWQQTVPAHVWLQRWQPGWALAAVGGWAADFLDIDPRNGGDASFSEIALAGQAPNYYGVQETPSGGQHHLISPTGERKATGFLPGLDLQAGDAAGQGRGFVWIAPTVKRSKVDGVDRAYRWTQAPDLDWLAEFSRDPVTGTSADGSIEGLRLRVAAARERRADGMRERRERDGSRPRDFTPMQMLEFLAPLVTRVEKAQIGEIEEQANALACALSHFVPAMLTEDQAYGMLLDALGETAYDPAHPASGWEASKFTAVISDIGGRAPGDWHAVPGQGTAAGPAEQLEQAMAATPMDGDEVSALLAEMLPPSALVSREPPPYLIKGLLTLDSTPWLVGGPGSKKSFVALDMAAHVALGKPWQGRKVNKSVVVMIMGEGAGSVGKRVRAWQSTYGPMPDDALRVLPRPVQAGDAAKWAVLVRACERLRAAIAPGLGMFVIVDTQARATVGLDENSAEEMGTYVAAVTALKEVTGGCVMSVHHTTKAGISTRGSGALDGAQDTRLLMESKPGTLDGRLSVKKQKDLEEAEPIELHFGKVDVGQDVDGEPIDSLVLLPASGADAWRSGLFDGGSAQRVAQEEQREISPFAMRSETEDWTAKRCRKNAHNVRWALQALADTGQGYGLTKAELRKLVDEKRGGKKMDESTWADVVEVLVSQRYEDLVIKVQGAARWTIDPVTLAVEKVVTDG